jgi:hypothetical protein
VERHPTLKPIRDEAIIDMNDARIRDKFPSVDKIKLYLKNLNPYRSNFTGIVDIKN